MATETPRREILDKTTGNVFQLDEDGLLKLREHLQAVLKENRCEILFIKKDGSERVMKCSLKTSDLPPAPPESERSVFEGEKKNRKVSMETLPVFDLEKKDWRAFRLDSIVSIDLLKETLIEVSE